ncbi:LysR family transcriptional regulator [Clostridiales bacterium FE2011]|nr:LysR family transcriptional regulator [Clostridiales bacterium FE2011]
MIEIHVLQQLVAFADCGTLSAAAEKLHTSQPALTRSMYRLEADLGVPLFVRSKNRLGLNETGVRAAEYARRVLDSERDFETQVKAFDRSLHTLSVGFCAPVPQEVLTPVLNTVFEGMTLSADMKDDAGFPDALRQGVYQLAVMHCRPEGDEFFCKKCGHEDLFISVSPSNPLTFYPEIHLKDLDGLSILLFSNIGFWANFHRDKTPNTKYLLQVDRSAFTELAAGSDYPVFASSYFIRQGNSVPGRVNIPIVDSECHTDFYLVCLERDKGKFKKLFDSINDRTIY